MPAPNPPCKGCEERHDLCWSNCMKYKDFTMKNEAFKKRRREAIDSEQDWWSASAFPNHIRRKFKNARK